MASEDLLKKAVTAFNALSPEQQAVMLEEQRQSWVRGNSGLSRDERDMTSPMMRALKIVRETNDKGRQALQAWADSKTRPAPVAPVSPDATGAAQTFDQIVSYVLRYGGKCRDCADVDGICPNTDMPCGFELKTAVIKHTLKALEYGLSHGFIENPFSIPAPDATGKCGELETVLWGNARSLSQPHDPVVWERMCASYPRPYYTVELVTRSQAEALLAAKDAEIKACHENINLKSDFIEKTVGQLHQAEADNAAKDARVKELEQINANLMGDDENKPRYTTKRLKLEIARATEAIEAKLAAAEMALETIDWRMIFLAVDRRTRDSGESNTMAARWMAEEASKAVRAVLGGKPS